jgi:hypothetical protein
MPACFSCKDNTTPHPFHRPNYKLPCCFRVIVFHMIIPSTVLNAAQESDHLWMTMVDGTVPSTKKQPAYS